MKLPRISSFFFASALSVASVPAFAEIDFGKIAFVGDSITQGAGLGNSGTDKSLSYRYPLWKIFVSNGIAWNPVGSMSTFLDGSSASASQTPDFLGNVYDNTSEGHYGWRTYDFLNGPSGRNVNSGSGKLSEWLANTTYYPDGTPDTVTLLLGVNDLSYDKTIAETAANAKAIIQQYQAKNPNVNVHVFSVLPTNQTSDTWGGVPAQTQIKNYNTEIQRQISSGEWNTTNSTVQYHDITAGFDAANHICGDSVHPNEQGALIVAGNIARALGIEGSTVGRERRAANRLASQTSFASSDSTGVSVTVNTQGASAATMRNNNTSGRWSVNDAGNVLIKSDESTASDLRYQYSTEAGAHEFTLDVGFRMNDETSAQTNRLGIWCGNGETVGMVYIEKNTLFWDSTVLYRNSDLSNLFVDGFSSLRLAWLSEDTANAIASGYYVWLDGMLIGEALSGNTLDVYKNSIVIGNTSSAYDTFAEISDISFDAQKAWAPSTVPEPSAFGMLAGLAALALGAARRRRK
ncbi:MAG: PEP-CTERM sorting domain-containing protein [Opitutales bacterium]|nr:PEP-CTERM sorting domain-containing protein [Opitutales bacterium]